MPFCRFCGTRAPEEATFCGSCGQQIALPPDTPTQIAAPDLVKEGEPLITPLLPFPQPPVSGPIPTLQNTSQVGHIPTIQGTPQSGHIPTVQGAPQPTGAQPGNAATPLHPGNAPEPGNAPSQAISKQHGTTHHPGHAEHKAHHDKHEHVHHHHEQHSRRRWRLRRGHQTAPHATSTAGTAATSVVGTSLVVKVALTLMIVAAATVGAVKAAPLILHSASPVSTPSSTHTTPVVHTEPMPSTQTSCPQAGTARAAVTRPLLLGQDQNVVFLDNEPASGSLERYDVSTVQTTAIFSAPSASIAEAQVSPDGQWVFFVLDTNGVAEFRLIRMDGAGLQTLYCTESQNLSDAQWAPDQTSISFAIIGGINLPETTISLLNSRTGQLRTLSLSQGPLSGCCVFLHWLDSVHLAVVGSQGVRDMPGAGDLLLLDTNGNFKSLFRPTVPADTTDSLGQPCYDFTPSPDQTQLFFSQCSSSRYFPMANSAIVGQGPSSISVRPLTGGNVKTIYTNPNFAIVALQMISQTRLLFYVCNFSSQPGQSVDTSQNGLWTMNTDGSGLTHLTTATIEEPYYFLYGVAQPTWLVISRDGSMYASSISDTNVSNQNLLVGSLHGGDPKPVLPRQFTSPSTGNIAVIGWTTI